MSREWRPCGRLGALSSVLETERDEEAPDSRLNGCSGILKVDPQRRDESGNSSRRVRCRSLKLAEQGQGGGYCPYRFGLSRQPGIELGLGDLGGRLLRS